jgi:hypothetical protein
MKKLIVVLCVLLFATGSAFAGANVDVWGSMEIEGNYYDNYYLFPDDAVTFSDYEMEIELWLKLIASENTFVTTRFNMLDNVWANWAGAGAEPDIDLDRGNNDNNIAVERGFLTHIFSNGTKLEAGLMDSDAWGTPFGDNLAGNYRIQGTHDTPAGTLVGFVQKDRENGNDPTLDDWEEDDSDKYGIGLKTTLGSINFMPQIVYAIDSNLGVWDQDNDGRKTTTFTIAASGGKDNLGFEGEFSYRISDYSGEMAVGVPFPDDANTFGFYANLFANLDANRIGLIFAYSSWDDEAGEGFDMGDDFDVTILLDEAAPFLMNGGVGAGNPNLNPNFYGGLAGLTLAQVYATVAINNKITVMPSLTYFASSDDLNTGVGGLDVDANAYELNIAADYKITDMLTYSAAVAFAKIDAEVGGADIDDIDALRFLHKLSLDF